MIYFFIGLIETKHSKRKIYSPERGAVRFQHHLTISGHSLPVSAKGDSMTHKDKLGSISLSDMSLMRLTPPQKMNFSPDGRLD